MLYTRELSVRVYGSTLVSLFASQTSTGTPRAGAHWTTATELVTPGEEMSAAVMVWHTATREAKPRMVHVSVAWQVAQLRPSQTSNLHYPLPALHGLWLSDRHSALHLTATLYQAYSQNCPAPGK